MVNSETPNIKQDIYRKGELAMSKLEEMLNIYFGWENAKYKDFISEIDRSNSTRDEMFRELKCLLEYLNDEL